MKYLYFILLSFAVFTVGTYGKQVNSKLDSVVNYLSTADLTNLKEDVQQVAKLVKAGSSHSYCCAIDSKNETVETRTRLVAVDTIIQTQIVVGYKPCNGTSNQNFQIPSLQELLSGFNQFGTFATVTTPTTPAGCKIDPIYETVTYTKKIYQIEYYQVTIVTQDCPPQHQICCAGYTMISGQCIDSSVVGNLMDLINLGLIG